MQGLVPACANGDLFKVVQLLHDGVDPNAAFVGQYPLQCAIEEGHVDIVAMLLYKGAEKNLVRGKNTIKDAEAKNAVITKLLDDEAFRAEYQPGLVERVDAARVKAAEIQAAFQHKLKLLLIFMLTALMITSFALGFFVRLDPDAAAKALPKKLIEIIQNALSVVMDIRQNGDQSHPKKLGGQEL